MKQYFNTEPLACDPSSLPKYTPSKEMDIKKRDETRKQASEIRRTNESQAVEPIQEDSSLTQQLQVSLIFRFLQEEICKT